MKMGYFKGKSAIILFEKYSRLKRNFKGHSFWARGYYVSTVGLDEAKIRKYIKDQEINDSIEDKYDSDLSVLTGFNGVGPREPIDLAEDSAICALKNGPITSFSGLKNRFSQYGESEKAARPQTQQTNKTR